MLVSPNKKLTRKKGKIGTILTKNKQNIPFVIKLLFIFFNVFSNFFSKKSFIVYLEIKKLTDAPKEEARAIKSNASKNEKIAPIKIEKAAAKGRDKAAIIKQTKKNTNKKYL